MQTQASTQEMTKELKEVKGIFAGQQATRTTAKPLDTHSHQQLMLELATQLQTSLEVEAVVQIFMQYLHAYMPFDGYRYQLSAPSVELIESRQQGHSCKYNLSLQEDSLGELIVYRGRKFVESELVLLENLICSLLYPLRNAISYQQALLLAHQDALTGVKNRAFFDESLQREINLAKRHEQSFSLMVIDIDHFKKVNDSYGHSTGDEVLKNVACNIQKSIRETDLLFRYGGEEFVVLLSNSDCASAYEIADRILGTVRNLSLSFQGKHLSVSVSIGLACLENQDSPHTIFDRADHALYAAKNEGRDQIKVA